MLNKINKEETYCKCYKAHAEIINSHAERYGTNFCDSRPSGCEGD